MVNNFLTIDPGSNIGGAFFHNAKPLFTFVVKDNINKSDAWEKRIIRILKDFEEELVAPRQFSNLVYIERPIYMEATQKGRIAASSDSLHKLTTMYGAILNLLFKAGFHVEYLKPWEWKGQLNKKQLAHRLKLLTGTVYPDHVADAVGIGYYILGQFPNVRRKTN